MANGICCRNCGGIMLFTPLTQMRKSRCSSPGAKTPRGLSIEMANDICNYEQILMCNRHSPTIHCRFVFSSCDLNRLALTMERQLRQCSICSLGGRRPSLTHPTLPVRGSCSVINIPGHQGSFEVWGCFSVRSRHDKLC